MRSSTSEGGSAPGQLVRCPSCSGKLIYPTDIAASERVAVVSRRCPDCEHRDVVTTRPLAVLLWFERNVRIAEGLAALCDAVADGLPLEFVFDDPPSPRTRHPRARPSTSRLRRPGA
jgi:DNA-directed RNA polymerase subunit RPC12/RpoP